MRNIRQVLIDLGGAVAVADVLGVDVALVRAWATSDHIPQTLLACRVASLAGVDVVSLAGRRDQYPRAPAATRRRYSNPAADLIYRLGGPYQVAQRLGVTDGAVKKWVRAGKIPARSADQVAQVFQLQIADLVAAGVCD